MADNGVSRRLGSRPQQGAEFEDDDVVSGVSGGGSGGSAAVTLEHRSCGSSGSKAVMRGMREGGLRGI